MKKTAQRPYRKGHRAKLRIALKGPGEDAIEKVEIAYEPVWATGRTATSDLISQVQKRIRQFLKRALGDVNANSPRR